VSVHHFIILFFHKEFENNCEELYVKVAVPRSVCKPFCFLITMPYFPGLNTQNNSLEQGVNSEFRIREMK